MLYYSSRGGRPRATSAGAAAKNMCCMCARVCVERVSRVLLHVHVCRVAFVAAAAAAVGYASTYKGPSRVDHMLSCTDAVL